jgi:hypothetical protein
MKLIRNLIIFTFCFALFIEVALRFYGFCSAPLYFESKEFEYLTLPNQIGRRFGNDYVINAFSQRSDEPSRKKKKILGIGDSVINGGVLTDQDDLATSIISDETNVQFLNISAGSWGPDNCAAYLKHFGTFESHQMILVCSSHDSHDNMDFDKVVGKHPSYPDKQFKIAWLELIERYVFPRIFGEKFHGNENVIKNGVNFNTGFDSLFKISKDRQIAFSIYLHAEQSELKNNHYSEQGEEIIKWARNNNIQIIRGIDQGFNSKDYRDNIHLNKYGQWKLAQILIRELKLF